MPNILADGAHWSDPNYGGQPPSYWTGTDYEYLGENPYGQPAAMTYGGTIIAGGTVAGTIVQNGDFTPTFSVVVNGNTQYSQDLASGQPYDFSVDLASGDTVVVGINVGGYLIYTNDGRLSLPVVAPVAPDETLTVAQGQSVSVTPVITQDGTPVTPDSLSIVTQPAHGTASVSGAVLSYAANAGYAGTDSFTYRASVGGTDSNIATVGIAVQISHNCDCDDTSGNRTLKQLRDNLMRRLGFSAQVNNPPPGMADLLGSFLIEAQEFLYRRYDVLRTERFYSWTLQAGVSMYDIDANDETCTKRLDPRKVTWVGVQRDDQWYPLACGISPTLYSGNPTGWPARYEIRQCIEVWPVPDETAGSLMVKGHFGLETFAADDDKTTIDDTLVFALALANAKTHYRQPDANNYVTQMEAMMRNLVAGSHQTRRYVPGDDGRNDYVYVRPKPAEPFPT